MGVVMSAHALRRLILRLRRRLHLAEGATATEYAIMLALIVLGSMGVIGSIGSKFRVLYTMIAEAVGGTI